MKKTVPLKKNYEFLRVYKKGKFYAGKYLVLYVLNNRSQMNRLGISVSRKVKKSVRRNRIKRLARESYRRYEDKLRTGYDLVISARHTEELPRFSDIVSEMKFLLKKMDVFEKENDKERESS